MLTEQHTLTEVANEDNESLNALRGNGMVLGLVDEVSGERAQMVPDFVPTRHELFVLGMHWIGEWLDIRFFEVTAQTTSGSDSRLRSFAMRRVDRIAALLGPEEDDRMWTAALEKAAVGRDPEKWQAFLRTDGIQGSANADS